MGSAVPRCSANRVGVVDDGLPQTHGIADGQGAIEPAVKGRTRLELEIHSEIVFRGIDLGALPELRDDVGRSMAIAPRLQIGERAVIELE